MAETAATGDADDTGRRRLRAGGDGGAVASSAPPPTESVDSCLMALPSSGA